MILSSPGSSFRVLAFGAYLKNRACLIDGGKPHWSNLHGDLSNPKACLALYDSARQLTDDASGPLDLLVHDMHPDFYSSLLASNLSLSIGVPSIAVQHHHAHIGSVMAEYELEGSYLGLALDGAGWGGDQAIWGGELLLVEGCNYQRVGHLSRLALPGGDKAADQPWRMAASALHLLGRCDEISKRLSNWTSKENAELVRVMLNKDLNCPLTSSAGRWFDAAAALLGLCGTQVPEAQAAQLLESAASLWLNKNPDAVSSGLAQITDNLVLDLSPVVEKLLDTSEGLVDRAAAQFHLELVDGLVRWVLMAIDKGPKISGICLSGGCFHNKILRERLKNELESNKLNVYIPNIENSDCGDAGLALGQSWVGIQYLKRGKTLD